MKTLSAIIAVFVATVLVHGGDAPPTHDDVVKQMLTTLDQLTTTLAPITSQETADAAKPELRKAAAVWVAVRAKAEKLAPPKREEKTRLEKEYKGKIEAAQKKLFAEVIRVQGVPGGPAALKEIRSVFAKQMK